MATIFHLALARDWAAAQETGAYTTSTRGRTLAEEGFIHASRGDQWPQVRAAFYADLAPHELVLLQIDTDLLDVPVVEESGEPGAAETFPHIYGPLSVTSVVRALPLPATTPSAAPAATSAASPQPLAPAPESAATPSAPSAPTESFSRLYFREMFFNMALLTLVMLAGVAGAILGGAAAGDAGPGIGGLAGIAVGGVVAVLLYRRRHRGRSAA
jgi:uncharacterized protein (DUF952 family)